MLKFIKKVEKSISNVLRKCIFENSQFVWGIGKGSKKNEMSWSISLHSAPSPKQRPHNLLKMLKFVEKVEKSIPIMSGTLLENCQKCEEKKFNQLFESQGNSVFLNQIANW